MEGENGVQKERVSAETHTIDWDCALGRVDGNQDALEEIVQIFCDDECPQMTQCIREAFAKHDAELLERSAHTLKSSADLFGAKRAFEAARTLEQLARESDFQQAAQTWKTLEQELANMLAALANPDS